MTELTDEDSSELSLATLTPKFVYGVKPGVRGGIAFISEDTLLYPGGCGVVLHTSSTVSNKLDKKKWKQELVPLADKGKHITALAINKNKKLLAFAERGDRPYIVIFDLAQRKRRKVLRCAELLSEEVISLSFSHDSKYVLAQGGPPDYGLVYFFWDKNKVITSLKGISSSKNYEIVEVSFNPNDRNIVCVIGKGAFRICRLSEGVLKSYGFNKAEHHSMTCHNWLSSSHVIIGTKAGKILVLENADLKVVLDFCSLLKAHLEIIDGEKESVEDFIIDEDKTIYSLITYSKGIMLSFGQTGLVAIIEVSGGNWGANEDEDEEMIFQLTQTIRFDESKKSKKKVVTYMALNGGESALVVLTEDLQIYYFVIKAITKDCQISSKNYFEIFSYPFHNGTIMGLDVCRRKPLVVTCGVDKTIRVWNYVTLSLELSKEFEETIFSVALHPSGMYLCAGFSDKLRLMNILIDDLRIFREFSIRSSTVCSFSCGGHLLATSTSASLISLYSTVDFQNRINLKGHEGRVTSIVWSSDDRKLLSCADDGSLYEWNIDVGNRCQESVIKKCSYNDLTLSPSGDIVYAVGSDKSVKMIKGSELLKEVDLHTFTLSSIVLSGDGNMLFAGSVAGKILSFKFPLTLPGIWQEYSLHGDTVSQMKLSLEDRVLISAGKDGSLCFWSVGVPPKGDPPQLKDSEFQYTSEILITKSELQEKNALISSLKQRVEEIRTEGEYQLRLKDNFYSNKMDQERKQFYGDLDDLRQNISKLEKDLESEKNKFANSSVEDRRKNEKALIELAEKYKAKLIIEYQKYDNLEDKYNNLQSTYSKKMEIDKSKTAKVIDEMKSSLDTKLKSIESETKNREEAADLKVSGIEEMLKQTEQDADKEILELRRKYEAILSNEKECNVRLRGEVGVLKKKYQGIFKDTEEQKNNIQKMNTENHKLNSSIKALEKDIGDLKKEIHSRDDTISFKEKEIIELKRYITELRKNRLVLEYKIEDLRDQIHPKDEMIEDLHSQVSAMENELLTVTKQESEIEVNLLDAKGKLTSTMQELFQERIRSGKLQAQNNNILRDVSGLLSLLQDAKGLKEAVSSLGKKYSWEKSESSAAGSAPDSENADGAEALNELLRQKVFLERNVSSLKARLEVQQKNFKQENRKKIKEATFMTQEIQRLKKELKKN